jgi:hypothetical protein
MDNIKNLKKIWINSLSFLDNSIINAIIVVILVLYSSTIFDNINSFIGNIYNFSIVKLIILLLIIYVAPKDNTIAILLAISYLVSLNYMTNNENFVDTYNYNSDVNDNNQEQPIIEESNTRNKEHFFPLINENSESNKKETFIPLEDTNNTNQSFDLRLNNINLNTRSNKVESNNLLNENSCIKNYSSNHESVGNVCSATSTFKDELNTQGLNFPEGFNSFNSGSPLH